MPSSLVYQPSVIQNQRQLLHYERHGIPFHASLTSISKITFSVQFVELNYQQWSVMEQCFAFAKIWFHTYQQLHNHLTLLLSAVKHADWVLLRSARSLELLLKYAGMSKDRKKVKQPKQLSQSEMKALCSNINKDGYSSLVTLTQRLHSQSGMFSCPEPYTDNFDLSSQETTLPVVFCNTEVVDCILLYNSWCDFFIKNIYH